MISNKSLADWGEVLNNLCEPNSRGGQRLQTIWAAKEVMELEVQLAASLQRSVE